MAQAQAFHRVSQRPGYKPKRRLRIIAFDGVGPGHIPLISGNMKQAASIPLNVNAVTGHAVQCHGNITQRFQGRRTLQHRVSVQKGQHNQQACKKLGAYVAGQGVSSWLKTALHRQGKTAFRRLVRHTVFVEYAIVRLQGPFDKLSPSRIDDGIAAV